MSTQTTGAPAARSTNPQPRPAAPLQAPKTPVGPGLITAIGLVLAVLLTAVGVVAVHDALVAAGALGGREWLTRAVGAVDGTTPAAWLVPVGVLLVLLGLWLLMTALRPRPRTAIALDADTGVFLRPRDVAKLARDAAQDVDGVSSAKASARRRAISVSVHATAPDGIDERVTAAVTERLRALATQPKIRVSVTTEGAS